MSENIRDSATNLYHVVNPESRIQKLDYESMYGKHIKGTFCQPRKAYVIR